MAIKFVLSSNPIVQRVIQETANDIPSAFESIASHANRREIGRASCRERV